MRVVVESVFPCDADRAWDAVQTSALLCEVTAPLVTIRAAEGERLPVRWEHGSTLRVRSSLFGTIPLGTRTISFERIDPVARELQSRESDPLIRRWDHLVTIRPIAAGRCRYRDEIVIEAGWLTLGVWLFAQWFYRHRQRRWKRVAKRLQSRDS